jgi:hypothetical protein
LDEGDRYEEDLNSIPDLMCGATAESATVVAKKCGGRIPSNLTLPLNVGLSAKSDRIMSWISDQSYPLRRAVIVFETTPTGGLSVFKFDMLE